MRRSFVIAFVTLLTLPLIAAERTTVTLLHFSDYHSHALPFFSEDRNDQGGIARAIGYLRYHKRHGALVFNGGDMMNRGAPAWSDKYGCVEWPWLNGVVDAMAFGNHDADYGFAAFEKCRQDVNYPILSANGEPFRKWAVFTARGRRIGVFAVAGTDFASLVKVPGLRFTDPIAAARTAVKQLREVEHVDAVVLIGHQHEEADFALARAVPGIDVIFGSHSHVKRELTQIPETSTWYISAFQYLTYVSRVDLTFAGQRIAGVTGRLVAMDGSVVTDSIAAVRVEAQQRILERDPEYAPLFVPFATLENPMSVERLTLGAMRDVANADVALSTVSSFRQALPAGRIDMETLRAALPYDNELLVAELPIATYRKLMELAGTRRGTDSELVVSGGEPGGADTVKVATTDYVARVAAGYRELFAGVPLRSTGTRVRQLVRDRIAGGARAP